VRHLDGKTPELYLSDLRNTREFKNETLAEFMAFELRSRMFHPRYVQELMNEGYAGATKMVDNLNNFWGWNVMDRSSVREDQWREFYDVYIKDKYDLKLREYFLKHHPAALAQLSERMLEAVRKGYWDAPEDVVRTLVETHQEIARTHDLHVGNDKFAEFVKAKAQGFGLFVGAEPAASPKPQETVVAPPALTQQVKGVELERQEAPQPDVSHWQYGLYAIIGGSFGSGIAWELAQLWLRRRRLV
jgi:cobaltochelatase CobN